MPRDDHKTMTHPMQTIRERLRWGQAVQCVAEGFLTAALLLLPRRWCVHAVARRMARRVYGCAEDEVFLYKSGRTALRGLMDGLRAAGPERRKAVVPDDVCNVVGDACRAAGFEVAEYPVDPKGVPDWTALAGQLGSEACPVVVVLCSLCGTVPALSIEAKELARAHPGAFWVLDECQNLVPDSPVRIRANQAVVFSFNDKTCPGVMGGGVVCSQESGVAPAMARSPFSRRVSCSVALFLRWAKQVLNNVRQAVRLTRARPLRHKIPDALEYSTCRRPHYDLVPEPIYKLSAARALVSLWFLESYRRIRLENAATLSPVAGIGLDAVAAGAPFLPVTRNGDNQDGRYPAPVKAAYGRSATDPAAPNPGIRLYNNDPLVWFETREAAVAQLTSRHAVTDNRILHCMARTADDHGFRSAILGPAKESGEHGRIELRACPVQVEGRRMPHVRVLAGLYAGALRSGFRLFHLHDPDLLPVGLMLKLAGRRVIYDVHDDYEASFRDRFRSRKFLRLWFPRLWWWFERSAARMLDGVVVADRHLAGKFTRCHPVIAPNYPRRDFTPPACAEAEATFNLIYVGGVTRERGVGMALEALRRLPEPDLQLHIIGAGREAGLLDELRADPRVVLHGRVPWTELHRHYVRARIGLALYQPLDSFLYYPGENAVKIVEYMAAGIPVICSDFPGLRAFVEESGCGLAVKPDDPDAIAAAIRRLIQDPELRKRLGARGRQLFEAEYHWEKHERGVADLYRRILEA
jgi:glycosyltransferase involved in cell wall biosynthesis